MKFIIKTVLFFLIISFMSFQSLTECAQFDDDEYYISGQGVDGKISKWQVTITGIRFKNSNGEFVTIYDNPGGLTQDISGGGSASAGTQCVTFTSDLTIPEGTYTQNWIRFGTNSIIKGYIKISDTEYYATLSTRDCLVCASAAEAESSAQDITFTDVYSTDWGRVNVGEEGNVVIDASKSYYSLFIKFNIVGLESGRPVGLVWNGTNVKFTNGMMSETFRIIDSDGNEQTF